MIHKVANRYSKAIYELAAEKKAVSSLINDMNSIHSLFLDSEEFKNMILSPVINVDDKRSMLESTILAKSSGLHDITKQLIHLLLNKKRIELLDFVCLSVISQDKTENNIVDAKIESTIPLDTKQIETAKKFLEKKFNKTVNIENLINAELVGGFRILIDNVMIDHSVQTHLSKLKQAMVLG